MTTTMTTTTTKYTVTTYYRGMQGQWVTESVRRPRSEQAARAMVEAATLGGGWRITAAAKSGTALGDVLVSRTF